MPQERTVNEITPPQKSTATILDKNQRDVARHALGLPNRKNRSFRNHFLAGDGSVQFIWWSDMVDKGLAESCKNDALWGKTSTMFRLTRNGAELALNENEALDPEDFQNVD